MPERPSRFDNRPDAEALIDAREACARLGVKPATLYTYVSRGLIRRVAGPSRRERRYLAEDVERVRTKAAAHRGHRAVAAGALGFGAPVLDSSITRAGPDRLLYRGQDAVALAEAGARFEQVAEHLWEETGPLAPWPLAPRFDRPRGFYPWRLATLLPRLAIEDEARVAPPGGRDVNRARRLVAAFADALGPAPRRRPSSVADAATRRLRLAVRARPAVEAALVLVADHELNASTFAARITASTGADLYACVGAALYAFTGPRHGNAAARVDAWVTGLGPVARVRRSLRGCLDRGEVTPGFGHPLYPGGDPRAPLLLAWAERLAQPGGPKLRPLFRAIELMAAEGGPAVNLDGALLALAYALDRPPELATALFCLGRSAGWIAHVFEQRRSPNVLRPRARYVGPQAGSSPAGLRGSLATANPSQG